MKNDLIQKFVHQFFPKTSEEVTTEIDKINIRCIYIISMCVIIVEVIGLLSLLINFTLTPKNIQICFSVSFCITVCTISMLISYRMKKNHYKRHSVILSFIGTTTLLMLCWGMYISYTHYIKGEQIITFYCVIIIIASFINIRPGFSVIAIIGSFSVYYAILYAYNHAATIETFNFISLAFLCSVAAVIRYHIAIRQVEDNLKFNQMNELLKKDIRYVSDQAKERELELSNIKIKLMQQQISPHFIFNALGIIKSLIWEDQEKAEQSVTEFSLYLRRNIEALRSTRLIPFQKELEHINAFLAIEKADDTVDLTIEYDLHTMDFFVPPLSVEPIVENAVIHGVSKLEKGAKITIHTKEEPEHFIIRISDNGKGFEKSTGNNGVGIENVRKRLHYQCKGQLSIDSTNKGSTVTIYIPKSEVQNENTGFR